MCFFHFDAQLDGTSIKSQCMQFNFNEGEIGFHFFYGWGWCPPRKERWREVKNCTALVVKMDVHTLVVHTHKKCGAYSRHR